MSISGKLAEARQKVAVLLDKGHIAKVEEVYRSGELIEVNIHHYPMCPQCKKEREAANGKERKV
jgi:hypothetical protein